MCQETKPKEEVQEESKDGFLFFPEIVKLRHVVLKDDNEVTVVVRKNGQVDLYWNKKITDSSINYNEGYIYKDVFTNFQSVILKRKKGTNGDLE